MNSLEPFFDPSEYDKNRSPFPKPDILHLSPVTESAMPGSKPAPKALQSLPPNPKP